LLHLKKLSCLNVSNTNVTVTGIKQLRQALPSCQIAK